MNRPNETFIIVVNRHLGSMCSKIIGAVVRRFVMNFGIAS